MVKQDHLAKYQDYKLGQLETGQSSLPYIELVKRIYKNITKTYNTISKVVVT